jgi:hypothetical protein
MLTMIYGWAYCELWIKRPTCMLPHGVADPRREHGLTSFRSVDLDGVMLSASFPVQGCANIECQRGFIFDDLLPGGEICSFVLN